MARSKANVCVGFDSPAPILQVHPKTQAGASLGSPWGILGSSPKGLGDYLLTGMPASPANLLLNSSQSGPSRART
jgi:hypothetical protein